MPDYDFHTISPVDFETLTRDLLQARDGIIIQSFKTGRDGGIDLRYATDSENHVIQCKHYRKSGLAALVREVRKEAPKIARMRPAPTRYILSTSVELSDANKRELAAILGAATTEDILGSSDLNNLLGLFPQIERAHFKLWLASAAVLERVLHNAEVTQSDFEFRRIQRRIPRFVQSRCYDLAARQFEQQRILILSGSPGVGKTTMAEFLLYEKFAQGFEPVIARNGLEEARSLYKPGSRQVFYYDDFLGATFLGEGGSAFARSEDREISDFLEMIAEDEHKYLILTTREHILAEAIAESERLEQSAISHFRYVIEVRAYLEMERAQILYNHAYFNQLPRRYLDELLRDEFYIEIIRHPKFSPRLIDWLTSPRRIKAHGDGPYQSFAKGLLNDPSAIWRFAYERQISHAARSLLLVLHSLEGRASHSSLSHAFTRLHAERSRKYRFATSPGDLRSALRVLNGSFVALENGAVLFLDPSVRDLMNSVLLDEPENTLDILNSARFMLQVNTVWTIAETSDGEHVMKLMCDRPVLWCGGVIEALDAAFDDGPDEGPAFSMEECLALVLDMAFYTEASPLKDRIMPTVRRVQQSWNVVTPRFRKAVEILKRLNQPFFRADMVPDSVRLEMRSALMTQTLHELTPSEARQLLDLEEGVAISPDDRTALRLAAGLWPIRMPIRLRECRSKLQLKELLETLTILSEALDLELRGPISAVRVELEMYVREPAKDYWTRQDMERNWERRTDDGVLASLFSSLHVEED